MDDGLAGRDPYGDFASGGCARDQITRGSRVLITLQEDVANGFIAIGLLVRYHDAEVEQGSEEPYLEFQSETRDKVKGLDHLAGKPQEEIPLPVRGSLFGIVLGTARGMIRAQTSGFDISQMELPVASPMQVLQDAEFHGGEIQD